MLPLHSRLSPQLAYTDVRDMTPVGCEIPLIFFLYFPWMECTTGSPHMSEYTV